jgi:hypothetical protein
VQQIIDAYLKECEGEVMLDGRKKPVLYKGTPVYKRPPVPPTVAGLCYALGFASVQSLREYELRDGDPVGEIITRAKLFIRKYVEERLFDRDGSRGAIWWLAVHAGEREKTEDDGPKQVTVIVQEPASYDK